MGQGSSGHRLKTIGGSGSNSPSLFDNDAVKTNGNKFSNKKEWPSALEEEKQGKHIPGHPNFQKGKSELTVSMDEAKELVDNFSGTGKVKSDNKELVDFGKIIGFFVKQQTGEKIPTTKGIIHHSKKGTHIVPANPQGD